jgi:YVTN family beta-propeller protein
MTNQYLTVKLWMLIFCSLTIAPIVGATERGRYLGPESMASSRDGQMLYVTFADAKQIAFVDIRNHKVARSIATPAKPTGLTLSPDGQELYVTCAAAQSILLVMDAESGKIKTTIPAGHTACGPTVTPNGKRLYVCNRFDNNVSMVDLKTRKEVARITATREPLAAAVTPDGKSLLVVNHLPADRADTTDVAAVVTIIDTQSNSKATIRLPSGASGLRGICVSPDGKHAYVTHILARYELPTIQVDYGWMNANALSVIDTKEKKLLGTVLLDEMYLGAANPWGVACTKDAKWICVTHAGTHELTVIDAQALMKKLLAMPVNPEPYQMGEVVYDDRNELLDYFRRLRATSRGKPAESGELYTLGSAAGVSNDLTFLAGLRRRIKLKGKGPRGIAIIGSKAYIAEYFSDTLGVVELESKLPNIVQELALGPKPKLTDRRRGEMFFNDAKLCFQHWQSCASCHPDGRMDGLNWDLTNDGIGNLKNTKSLILSHKTPPVMSSGVRALAEEAVRGGIKHILFTDQNEQDAAAIDEYLKSIEPIPSPYLVEGKLSRSARRGRKLFFSEKTGCSKCHTGPLYTDMQMHDIGSKSPCDHRKNFDTPILIEVWRTAPYFHDGRCTTVKESVSKCKNHKEGGEVELDEQQIDDLVEFVLSL